MNELTQEDIARMDRDTKMIHQKSVTFTIRMDKEELVRAIETLAHGGYKAKNRSDVIKTICRLWLEENYTPDVKRNIDFYNLATFGEYMFGNNNYKKPTKE
jgi:hypothetical protein